jgi:hypothetical protein
MPKKPEQSPTSSSNLMAIAQNVPESKVFASYLRPATPLIVRLEW